MRTYLLLFVLFLLVIGCKQEVSKTEELEIDSEIQTRSVEKPVHLTQEKQVSPSQFTLEPSTKAEFERAQENYTDSFISDTLEVRKVSGKLNMEIYAKRRPHVVFTDTLLGTDNDEIREYTYLGQYQKLKKYVVGGNFWEHYESYLVDKESGEITTLWNRPYISPDKKHLACLSMTYGLEGVPNGIQIWKAVHNEKNRIEAITLEKYIEIDQQIWAPYDFYWHTNESIILKVLAVDRFWEVSGEPEESDFYFLRLTLR